MTTSDDDVTKERAAHLKRKFQHLRRRSRIKELIRWERARQGQLQHRYPQEYVVEVVRVLGALVEKDFDYNYELIQALMELYAKEESRPFM